MTRARITTGVRAEAISIDEVMGLVAAPGSGGTVVFVGTVRSHSEGYGSVDELDYTIYREMAEPMLALVAEEAAQRWPLNGVCILHRVGNLAVGEQTVVVACSAPHRGEAFEAARYGIDEVKARVPVWKREIGPGGPRWIGIDQPAEDRTGLRPSARHQPPEARWEPAGDQGTLEHREAAVDRGIAVDQEAGS